MQRGTARPVLGVGACSAVASGRAMTRAMKHSLGSHLPSSRALHLEEPEGNEVRSLPDKQMMSLREGFPPTRKVSDKHPRNTGAHLAGGRPAPFNSTVKVTDVL